MSTISDNITAVREKINRVANGRAVKLLAVSKTFPNEAIAQALAAGQRCFGENYAQEGAGKVEYFREHYAQEPIEWHFIGPLQSNKTRLVAEHFDWVQSIDRLKIAQRLNDQRPLTLQPLNVLVEINIDNEPTKSGVSLDQLQDLLPQLMLLPRIRLRGLMCVPKADSDEVQKRKAFSLMKETFDQYRAQGYPFDTLSMGMSADFEWAVEEGANLVRIGSAIFGARDYSRK